MIWLVRILFWRNNEVFWFDKRFELAKGLKVEFLFKTNKREYYKVGENEVTLNKNLIDINCTCKECSVVPDKLCEHKISCIVFRMLNSKV